MPHPISKYENHLPLYRQQQMFALRYPPDPRRDGELDHRVGHTVVPLINLLKDEQISSS